MSPISGHNRTNEPTRRAWRELGFYYTLDFERSEWRLVGSRAGLMGFADLLRDYAADPENTHPSRQRRYGPYMYLIVRTTAQRGIDRRSIHGSPQDIAQLASVVEAALHSAEPGNRCSPAKDFCPGSDFSLVLEIKPDGFDPASADPMLPRI